MPVITAYQREAVVQRRRLRTSAAAATAADDADYVAGAGAHIRTIVAAAVNIDDNIIDCRAARIPRPQITENTNRHRLCFDFNRTAIDTVVYIDGHGVGLICHLHLAKDTADIVRTFIIRSLH